jgi:hypothetical protein
MSRVRAFLKKSRGILQKSDIPEDISIKNIKEMRLKKAINTSTIKDSKSLEKSEDVMDIKEADRLLTSQDEKPIPYEQVREELGLD